MSSSGVGGERDGVVDPAGEIHAAIGSNNAGKYMVASQVCAISSSRGSWRTNEHTSLATIVLPNCTPQMKSFALSLCVSASAFLEGPMANFFLFLRIRVRAVSWEPE